MDWTNIGGAAIGGLLGVMIPALILAYWVGQQAQKLVSIEQHCSMECDRQQREHSHLFDAVNRHGEAITSIRGDVKAIDGRVGVIERKQNGRN